ncbi:MAG TPA: nucleotidyltransferase domain-containing protein [Herpetosiphonaceae bacterium]
MFPHHEATIQRTIDYFRVQPNIRALLLAGSIAHGFAEESSDVDVLMIVSEEEHRQRTTAGDLAFFNAELSTYPGGYVDGKFLSQSFLDQVEERGSEPARFAFADARILFGDIAGLGEQLQRIAQYPSSEKIARISRFKAQLEAWHWYASEADKKRNDYLMSLAINKLLLFSGRMILAHNELLYPYHKWFFAMLERAEHKPDRLIETMRALSRRPSYAGATELYTLISEFRTWESDGVRWPNHFMRDNELTWLHGSAQIDDL